MNQLLFSNEYWTIPFIIQLIGEYVLEILEFIWENFNSLNSKNIIYFISENEIYWFKTKQRISSYWDCNYSHISKKDYVGFKLIKRIEEISVIKNDGHKNIKSH